MPQFGCVKGTLCTCQVCGVGWGKWPDLRATQLSFLDSAQTLAGHCHQELGEGSWWGPERWGYWISCEWEVPPNSTGRWGEWPLSKSHTIQSLTPPESVQTSTFKSRQLTPPQAGELRRMGCQGVQRMEHSLRLMSHGGESSTQ